MWGWSGVVVLKLKRFHSSQTGSREAAPAAFAERLRAISIPMRHMSLDRIELGGN